MFHIRGFAACLFPALLLCSAPTATTWAADKPPLKVATFAGGYAKVQKQTLFDVYTEETGIPVEVIEHTDGQAARTRLENGDTAAHVMALDLRTARKACADGLVVPLEAAEIVDAEKDLTLEEDFVPFGISRCGIANGVNSLVIAYDRSVFDAEAPQSPEDFFDLEKFPGQRGLRPEPHGTLVLALLAAGTSPENIYKTLESAQGVETAFHMLKQLEGHIVWWQSGQQATDFLATKAVTMTTAFQSWVYHARVSDKRPFGIIWNGQQAYIDVWVIPEGAARRSLAANFISFATSKQRLAAQSNAMPYGPSRQSAFPLINAEMREHLPNVPEHGTQTVWVDHQWWEKFGGLLTKRFAVWVAKTQGS